MCASGVIHRPLLSVLQDCPVSCVRRSVILIGNILKPFLLEIKVLRVSYHLICKPFDLGVSSIHNLQMWRWPQKDEEPCPGQTPREGAGGEPAPFLPTVLALFYSTTSPKPENSHASRAYIWANQSRITSLPPTEFLPLLHLIIFS